MQQSTVFTSIQTKFLLDLDDDVLMEIFRKLSVIDLCNVATVCNRFCVIARRVYHLYHRNSAITFRVIDMVRAYGIRKADFLLIRMISNFGDLMTNIVLRFDTASALENEHQSMRDYVLNLEAVTYNMIVKYCSAGQLKQLEMYDVQRRRFEQIMIKLSNPQPLLASVNKLTVRRCDILLSTSLAKCADIVELTIDDPQFIGRTYPNLRKLQLLNRSTDTPIDMESVARQFKRFLARHRHLTEIKLEKIEYGNLAPIGQLYANTLEKLEIDVAECYRVQHIGELINLKTLIYREHYLNGQQTTFQLVNNFLAPESLVHLEICSFDLPNDFLSELSKFKNLQTLKLCIRDVLYDFELINLYELKQLTELVLGNGFGMTGNGLAELVKELCQLERLTLHTCKEYRVNRLLISGRTYRSLGNVCREQQRFLTVKNSRDLSAEFLKVRFYPVYTANMDMDIDYEMNAGDEVIEILDESHENEANEVIDLDDTDYDAYNEPIVIGNDASDGHVMMSYEQPAPLDRAQINSRDIYADFIHVFMCKSQLESARANHFINDYSI